MSPRIEKLEALLERVRRNRERPRGEARPSSGPNYDQSDETYPTGEFEVAGKLRERESAITEERLAAKEAEEALPDLGIEPPDREFDAAAYYEEEDDDGPELFLDDEGDEQGPAVTLDGEGEDLDVDEDDPELALTPPPPGPPPAPEPEEALASGGELEEVLLERASELAPEPDEPMPLSLPRPPPAPVARVASPLPERRPPPFGALLDRTLGLRPRE